MKFKLMVLGLTAGLLTACMDSNLSTTSSSSVSATDWPTSNGFGSAKYSPLTQITLDNVSQLEVAWEFVLGEPGDRSWQTTRCFSPWQMVLRSKR